jgi:uncharacterized heparinase superfamily protein
VATVPTGVRLDIPALDLPPSAQLPGALAGCAEKLRDEAEAILRHEVDFLGSGPQALGPDIDWHRDFKSGYQWPDDFYLDVCTTRLDDDSDAKVPWELSRGHQLLTLARAARLFGDERYALELERQLDSWLRANPPGYGINWTTAMEVALRAVNWIWAIRTLEAFRPLEARLRERVTRSLQAHARHLALNVEGTPYLRSNHYLSDILGLLALAWALPADPAAGRWNRIARAGLEREVGRQVHPDGVGFEASLSYHGLCLEIFILAGYIAECSRDSFSSAYQERVRRMLVVSRAVRHPDGRIPLFGDGDSGRVLPGGFDRPPTHDNLLWLGAAAFGGERPLPGPAHEEVAWTFGISAWSRTAALAAGAPPESAAFPQGGLFALRGGDTLAVVRCGDVGQNGNGGHAHNDVLSYELSFGSPLIVDSGTYAYTFDPAARNAFRSARAHNTIVIDGAEPNPVVEVELFRLRGVARPKIESWLVDDRKVQLIGSHDGFRRLAGRPCHRRSFTLDRLGALAVDDEILGSGRHVVRSYVHLVPGARAEAVGDGHVSIELDGRVHLLEWWGVDALALEDGWVSDRYGVRVRGNVVIGSVEGELPLRFGFRFVPHAEARLAAAAQDAVVSA